jgi:osmotically-inducible protein OsmY
MLFLKKIKDVRLVVFPVSLLLMVVLQVIVSPAPAVSQDLNDWDINLAVEDALVIEEAVDALFIDVETVEGVVTLSGYTANPLSKEKAASVARTIKGVRSVINNIEVRTVLRSDDQILLNVQQALLEDPATEAYNLDIGVSDGIVTLKGEVHSWQEKQMASEVAMSVKGVKAIENDIEIKYPQERLDLEIQEDIEGRLASDVWVDELLIKVQVQDGEVFLSGTVGSGQEKK